MFAPNIIQNIQIELQFIIQTIQNANQLIKKASLFQFNTQILSILFIKSPNQLKYPNLKIQSQLQFILKLMLAIMKGCSSIGAIFILIIGLAMSGVTIYGYFHPELFLNDTQDRNVILGILIGADIAIVLGALLGMCGIKKQNNALICIFQILVIIFCIVFLGLGIGASVLTNTVFPGNCTNSDNTMIEFAYDAYQKSTVLFCTPLCPCNITQAAKQSPTYSDIQRMALNALSNSTTGPINTQGCPLFMNESLRQIATALQGVETLLDCSFWCDGVSDTNLIYRFSDVNRGKPQKFCYTAMKEAVNGYSMVIGIAALAVSGFLLLMCLCNICLCCHPDRKNLSLRQRFVYQHEGRYQQPGGYAYQNF